MYTEYAYELRVSRTLLSLGSPKEIERVVVRGRGSAEEGTRRIVAWLVPLKRERPSGVRTALKVCDVRHDQQANTTHKHEAGKYGGEPSVSSTRWAGLPWSHKRRTVGLPDLAAAPTAGRGRGAGWRGRG
jgi:hypothetical protein